MLKINLTEASRLELNQLRFKQTSNIGERAHYLLLLGEGKSIPEIANHVGRNAHTVREWVKRYLDEGVKGLSSQRPPGRTAKKAPFLEFHLKEMMDKQPKDYGYQEAGWQINILCDFFARKGIEVCEYTLSKALKKLGFVYKRFSKTLPKNIPSKDEKRARVAQIVTEIQAIKNEEKIEAEIFFADESHFSNQPYVNRGWFKRGEKKR